MKTSSRWFKVLLVIAALAGFASASQAGAATGGVSAHIVLPNNSLVPGGSERGTLVIANQTGRPIRWGCFYLEVQLTNAQWPLYEHPTPCGRTRTLAVGTTRLRFTLRATHASKPLPPGTYNTQLLAAPKVLHPNPITVHVVAQR